MSGSRSAVPVAPITFSAPLPPNVGFVPVVYLKNEIFKESKSSEMDQLAEHVWQKISAMARQGSLAFREIQIDCDWTETTKELFFAFTGKLRRTAHENGVLLSATIRLHQIKFADITGVPPVDRGMLMFYNLGTIDATTGDSSIYNRTDALKYAKWIKSYKLPMDVVLPIFSWGIQSRDGRVVALIEDMDREELSKIKWLHPESEQFYVADDAGFFHGHYFSRGDHLKFEATTPETTAEAAILVSKNQASISHFQTIAIFDLNERNLKTYAKEDFNQIFARF